MSRFNLINLSVPMLKDGIERSVLDLLINLEYYLCVLCDFAVKIAFLQFSRTGVT